MKKKIIVAEAEDGMGWNVILYTGLSLMAAGLVITSVGLGEKGFTAVELQMVGPGLVGCGLLLAGLRVVFLTVTSCVKDGEGSDTLFERRMFVDQEISND